MRELSEDNKCKEMKPKKTPRGRNFGIRLKSPIKFSEKNQSLDSPRTQEPDINNNIEENGFNNEKTQKFTWEELGKIFEPEQDCLVGECMNELKKVILNTQKRQKSPNTVAIKIGERFGENSAKEIFLRDPKTGQVEVTLENGKIDPRYIKFVHPEDYYPKKIEDYAQRKEKAKATIDGKKKETKNSIDDNGYEEAEKGDEKEDLSEDFEEMEEEEQPIKKEKIESEKDDKEKHSENNVVFEGPYGEFSNSEIINNINEIIPQEEEEQHPRIIPEDEIEHNSEEYPIQQELLLNLNKHKQFIQQNTGRGGKKQEEEEEQEGRTHLEISKINKGIKKHEEKHGEKAREKSEKEKNTKNDEVSEEEEKTDIEKEHKIATKKNKEKENSLKKTNNKENPPHPLTSRERSLEDSRISQQRKQ